MATPTKHPQQAQLDEFLNSNPTTVPSEVDALLAETAKRGSSDLTWTSMKALLLVKLHLVLDDYIRTTGQCPDQDGETFFARYERVQSWLASLSGPPFTLQRMCELLIEPKRVYRNTSTFFQAFSKCVCGITARPYTDGTCNFVAVESTVPDLYEVQSMDLETDEFFQRRQQELLQQQQQQQQHIAPMDLDTEYMTSPFQAQATYPFAQMNRAAATPPQQQPQQQATPPPKSAAASAAEAAAHASSGPMPMDDS